MDSPVRLGGGVEMSSGGGEVVARWWMEDWVGQVAAGRPGGPTFACGLLGGTAGEQDKLHNPGFQHGEIKPQNL